jgi:hypothetical protein
MKNIHRFSKSLAAKVGWRLITTESLWTKVVIQKYISPDSVEEWIRRPTKEAQNYTIIWKYLLKYFSVVGQGLAWRVGRGTKVRIGQDPWPGSDMAHLLPHPLIDILHEGVFFTWLRSQNRNRTTMWGQEWKGALQLGLGEEFIEAWNDYIIALKT